MNDERFAIKMRRKLRGWRRRWCIWRGHPMAEWSPVCLTFKNPDRLVAGVIVPGDEYVTRAWRCARHDRP